MIRFAAISTLVIAISGCEGKSQDAVASVPGAPPRTVLLVVVDGVSPANLATAGPAFERLYAEGRVFDAATTVSVGEQAAFASLLTGLLPTEHGVGSLRERGRQHLADRLVTLAERFREAGFRTLGAVSLPELSGRISGLDQGFETFLQPELVEQERDAAATFALVRSPLVALLKGSEPVFACLHFADGLYDKSKAQPSARSLRRHLGAYADRNPAIREALSIADSDPAGALAALERVLGRGRGSPEYQSYREALFEGRLRLIDDAFGRLVSLLDQHGRLDDAALAVVGLRGRMDELARARPAPTFPRRILRVPFVLRHPGAAGALSNRGRVQTIDLLPALAEICGWPGLTPVPGPALCADSALEWRAAFDDVLMLEVHAFGDERIFRATEADEWGWVRGATDLDPDEQTRVQTLRTALDDFGRPAEWIIACGAGPSSLEVHWRFAEGFSRGARIEDGPGEVQMIGTAGASGVGGQASIGAAGARLIVSGGRRELPLRLRLVSDGVLDEARILVGDTSLARHPLLRMPSSSSDPWPESEVAAVHLAHHGGGWWRLAVERPEDEGSQVEALVALYPPGRLDDEIEWSTGPRVQVEHVPGRADAVRVTGRAPLSISFQKTPRRELALAVRVGEDWIDAAQLRLEDKRFSTPGERVLYLPDWMPGITDVLDASVRTEMPAPGTIRLSRSGGGDPRDRAPLDLETLSFARKLEGKR